MRAAPRARPARTGGCVDRRHAGGRPADRVDGCRRSRPRISFGAPLPVGMAADGELIDVVLVERWPAWRVREAPDSAAARRAGASSTWSTSGSPDRRSPAGSPRPTTASSSRGSPDPTPLAAAAAEAAGARPDRTRAREGCRHRHVRPPTAADRRRCRAWSAGRRDDADSVPPGARHGPPGGGRGRARRRPRRPDRDRTDRAGASRARRRPRLTAEPAQRAAPHD